jgi:hypothetical protein
MSSKKKGDRKTPYDRPVSLHPLTFREALEGLLKVKPPPKEKKVQEKDEEKEPRTES